MREVSVVAEIDATPEAIFDALSPRSIVEYEQTYDVAAVERVDEGWRVTAVSEEPGVEMELHFRRQPGGYVYDLVGGGPFEVLHTTLTVHDGPADAAGDGEPTDPVRVTMTSEYTLGGWLAPVVDWLAASNRERELEQALLALASEVGALDPDGNADSDGSDGSDNTDGDADSVGSDADGDATRSDSR